VREEEPTEKTKKYKESFRGRKEGVRNVARR